MWVLMFIASHVYAQTRTITGTVTEKDEGGPLPGVSVTIKGTKTGTQTNAQGKFTISASNGQSLVFTSVGYLTKTIEVTGATINLVMESNQTQLADVMVIGYGTQTRRDNVGSVAQIKGGAVAEQPVQNFEQALGGRAAGVQVTMANGVSNTPPVIHIRGTNSISLSSQPLFIVDGIPVFTGDLSTNIGGESGGNALANINPDDIESIDVAKDASATAIYGSRAANGVVFVTTKKGKKGNAVVTIDSWIGSTSVTRLPKVLNAQQYVDIKNEAMMNSGIYNTTVTTPQTKALAYTTLTPGPDGKPIDTDWEKLLYRRATTYNTTASISGATDKTSYYLSSNWTKQQGILQGDEFDSKGMLANVDHKANKYISIGGKISYTNNQNLARVSSGSLGGEAYSTNGLGRLAILLPPNLSPYNNDGSYNLNGTTIGIMNNKGYSNSYPNPQPYLDLDRENTELNHVAANIYFQVNPLPWITLKTVYGIDYIFANSDSFADPIANANAQAIDNYSSNKRSVWTNTAQFDRSFGKHSFNLLLGTEQQQSNVRGFGLNRSILSDPSFNVIQANYSTNNPGTMQYSDDYLVSFFGRLNYNFSEKYFLSASLRRDGYSAFGSNSKYGLFPGVGLGWEITKENFWKTIGADKVFSSFKLKASYGKTGNNSGVNAYQSYGFYANSLYNGAGTLAPSQTGNNDLSWEVSKKTDAGISFGLFNDRITGDITYYNNDVTGLLLNVPTPPSAGLASSPLVNVGSMYNRGIEFNVDANVMRSKNFNWDANFNISYNQNKVTALSTGTNSITNSTSSLEIANITQVGYSVGNLYIVRSAGVDPATGERIFINGKGQKVFYSYNNAVHYTYADGTKAPDINQAADAVNYANAVPKVIGGFSNTFRYKSFDLSLLFTYQLGFDVYYGTGSTLTDQRFWNNSTAILNHWTTPGQIANYPKLYFGDNVSNGTSFPTDFNTYSGNFLRLKTVNLGYTIPKTFSSKLGLSSLRFYVTGQNLLLFTKYPGDPEIASNGASAAGNSTPGVDRNTSGTSRALTAGFLVKF